MTKKEIAYILSAISAIYNIQFDDFKIQLWHKVIGDLDYQKTEYVTTELLQTLKFPPTPADIREAYFAPEINAIPPAEAAAIVHTAVTRYGRYDVPKAMEFLKSQSLLVYDLVQKIGFITLCDSEARNFHQNVERQYKDYVTHLKHETQLSAETKEQRQRLYAVPTVEETKQILANIKKKLLPQPDKLE